VVPDTLVGICLERSMEMVIAILGVFKAGGAYIPLDPSYPKIRLQYMLDDAELEIVITTKALQLSTLVNEKQAICLDAPKVQSIIAGQVINNIAVSARGVRSSNLAYVIYTSGSTGQPKGVMIEHRALVNRIDWMQQAYSLTGDDHVLQKTPFIFDVSVWELIWPIVTGARMIIAKPKGHKDVDYLLDLINQQSITTLHFVPSMFNSFITDKRISYCSSLRHVFCSGEVLTLESQNHFLSVSQAKLYNLYGPTEAAIDVSYWECFINSTLNSVPIGRPINNVQLYVLDKSKGVTPIGVAGELYIGGVGLARGYLKRPELTAEKFVSNPFSADLSDRLYRTGDLVRWLADGNLEFLGRIDHQVKIRGFRIELGEIESILNQYALVKDVIVIAREDVPGEKVLVAYVVAHSNNSEIDNIKFITDLRAHLEVTLPKYMVPTAFVVLYALPLTTNGKLDRNALPAPDMQLLQVSYVAPRTDAEQTLCGIWETVLGIERIGIHDNFFALGGHSLSATRVVSLVRKSLGLELPLKVFFSAQTLGDLAQKIVQLAGKVVVYHRS